MGFHTVADGDNDVKVIVIYLICFSTIGRYVIGEHELTMEKVTYHIGFSRKPGWMEEGGKA